MALSLRFSCLHLLSSWDYRHVPLHLKCIFDLRYFQLYWNVIHDKSGNIFISDGLFLDFYPILVVFMSVLTRVPHCFDYYSLVINFEIRKCEICDFVLFFFSSLGFELRALCLLGSCSYCLSHSASLTLCFWSRIFGYSGSLEISLF
jgi:hypothetical protein